MSVENTFTIYLVMVLGCFLSLTFVLMLYRVLGFRECLGLHLCTWNDMVVAIALIGILSVIPPLAPIAVALYISLLKRIFEWVRKREVEILEHHRDASRLTKLWSSSATHTRWETECLAKNAKEEKNDVK